LLIDPLHKTLSTCCVCKAIITYVGHVLTFWLSRKDDSLLADFPGAMPDQDLVHTAVSLLGKYGFDSRSSLNLVSTCKDAVCREFTRKVEQFAGKTSDISSLAGFCFCGRTGLKMALGSAPVSGGKERCVFWVAPHMGIAHGKAAEMDRRSLHSGCCALKQIQHELSKGRMQASIDPQDIEVSLVRQQLATGLQWGMVPTLAELTRHAHTAALSNVRRLASATLDPTRFDYAIVAGVLVHGADGQDHFWPGTYQALS
jgi:hypothetical protein